MSGCNVTQTFEFAAAVHTAAKCAVWNMRSVESMAGAICSVVTPAVTDDCLTGGGWVATGGDSPSRACICCA